MNETFYETRIVPAIINVREWLDHMEANDPSPSVITHTKLQVIMPFQQ